MFNKKLKQEVAELKETVSALRGRINKESEKKATDLTAVYFHYEHGLEVGRKYVISHSVDPRYFNVPYGFGFTSCHEDRSTAVWTGGHFDVDGKIIKHKDVMAISEPIEYPEPKPIGDS